MNVSPWVNTHACIWKRGFRKRGIWKPAVVSAKGAAPYRSAHPLMKGYTMKKAIDRLCASGDEGMATVEYALVTVAAAAFAAVLIAIVKSPEVRSALASLVGQALSGS